jgi:hypothetical protein
MRIGQRFYIRKIHDHAIGGIAVSPDDLTSERNFNRISMPVQMATLAFVIRYTVTSVELEAAGNKHRKKPSECQPPIISLRNMPPARTDHTPDRPNASDAQPE